MSYGTNWSNADFLGATFSSGRTYPFSIVAWVKLTAAQWALTAGACAVGFGDDTIDTNNSLRLQCTTGAADRIQATSVSSAGAATGAVKDLTDGNLDSIWALLVGVWAAADDRKVYIVDSTSPGTNTATRALSGLDELTVGKIASDGQPFTGLVAEVAVFDAVLSDAAINTLQTAPETGIAPNQAAPDDCIGYWSLNTDQASHPDQSGNGGPTLAENGIITFDADHPTILSINTIIIVPTGPPLS